MAIQYLVSCTANVSPQGLWEDTAIQYLVSYTANVSPLWLWENMAIQYLVNYEKFVETFAAYWLFPAMGIIRYIINIALNLIYLCISFQI